MYEGILPKAQEWFADFCRGHYDDDPEEQRPIALKEDHTSRVCAVILRLAQALSLNRAGCARAELVALLHDVGRFPQYRRFRTFKDSISVNHAALGAQIVGESGILALLPEPERALVISVVRFHNVFIIPENFDSETTFYLKLLRDADKLDIWRVFSEFFRLPESERATAAGLGYSSAPECSPVVLDALGAGSLVPLDAVQTLNDFKLLQLSWVYDLNFTPAFQVLVELDQVGQLAETLPPDRATGRVVAKVQEYVAKKVRESAHDEIKTLSGRDAVISRPAGRCGS